MRRRLIVNPGAGGGQSERELIAFIVHFYTYGKLWLAGLAGALLLIYTLFVPALAAHSYVAVIMGGLLCLALFMIVATSVPGFLAERVTLFETRQWVVSVPAGSDIWRFYKQARQLVAAWPEDQQAVKKYHVFVTVGILLTYQAALDRLEDKAGHVAYDSLALGKTKAIEDTLRELSAPDADS